MNKINLTGISLHPPPFIIQTQLKLREKLSPEHELHMLPSNKIPLQPRLPHQGGCFPPSEQGGLLNVRKNICFSLEAHSSVH